MYYYISVSHQHLMVISMLEFILFFNSCPLIKLSDSTYLYYFFFFLDFFSGKKNLNLNLKLTYEIDLFWSLLTILFAYDAPCI